MVVRNVPLVEEPLVVKVVKIWSRCSLLVNKVSGLLVEMLQMVMLEVMIWEELSVSLALF